MDEDAEEKRREQNFIVRSGKSEAEVTISKRQRSRRRNAWANYTDRQDALRGLSATAELLVSTFVFNPNEREHRTCRIQPISAAVLPSSERFWNKRCTFCERQSLLLFLSASLYFSKRGAYWDRLCRDVVGRWLSRACTVAKRCILGL